MRMLRCVFVVAVCCCAWAAVEPLSQGQSDATVGDTSHAGPVAVPEPSDEAVRYYRSGIAWWAFNKIWEILLPGVILFTGFSAAIRSTASRLGRKWFFTIGLYWVFFVSVLYVVNWPISFYLGYVRQHAYGMSNQTFLKWLADSLIGQGVLAVFGFLFLWVPYLLLDKSPRRWWLYTGLLMVPFLAFVMFVMPVWIDPLYNKFGPMKDKDLENKILALAESAGIEGSRVYEVEKSVDTKAINAYVTGFYETKRIVLWDTIIDKLDDDELLFVMAHEMGHYVLGHVVWGIFFFSGLILAGLYLAHRIASGLLARYAARFGFDRVSDIASIPLMLVALNIAMLLLEPVGLAYSRHMEHEADRFALELTRDNRAGGEAFVKLSTENLGYPDPGWLIILLRSSHPPIARRVAFCNEYRPWESGAELRYGGLFHPEAKSQTTGDIESAR